MKKNSKRQHGDGVMRRYRVTETRGRKAFSRHASGRKVEKIPTVSPRSVVMSLSPCRRFTVSSCRPLIPGITLTYTLWIGHTGEHTHYSP